METHSENPKQNIKQFKKSRTQDGTHESQGLHKPDMQNKALN